jgi:L-fuconolactonase
LLPDLQQATQDLGIEGTIAVQARQTTKETKWLLDLADHSPLLLGVVGWVPLTDLDALRHLDQFAQHPKFKGVRHVLQDESDDGYMLRDDFNRGVNLLKHFGLAYDILIYERHLPQTLTFVDRHPGQVFILDHIAKPFIREGLISSWRDNIRELAMRENVYCKISGMATEANWKAWDIEELRPYFDVVLSAFAVKRLMFGSDWPVLTLAGGYRKWMTAFLSLITELSPDERACICRSTAMAAYQLDGKQT